MNKIIQPKRYCFPIVFFILVVFSPLRADAIPIQLENLILQGKEYLYQLNISKAQQTFEQIIREYPDYPHGYFYRAYLTLITFSQDMTNDSLSEALDEQVEVSVNMADQYRKSISQDADAKFHLGLSYGLRAINSVMSRNYFAGYWSGRKAKNYLEDVVKLDSTYYDAYLGLGIFHYYVDLLPGLVKFIAGILGFEGNKQKGREEILSTSTNGRFFRVEAYFSYYIVRYFLEGERRQSVEKFKQLQVRYPSNAALSLILAYHYRRFGFVEKTIEYCRSVPDSFVTVLPQIVDIKYYNLAVSYYDMNMFEKSDSMFSELIELPTRKSLYYQNAIRFYKGVLADLSFDRETAVRYLKNIIKHNQTKYWYHQSRMYLKYPMDSLMYKQVIARNFLYSRQYKESLEKTRELQRLFASGTVYHNPDIPFLIEDLLAQNYYYINDYRRAKQVYDQLAPRMGEIEDDFQRSWVYIHYARCLRAVGEVASAEKMLNHAGSLDDDFTRLIIEREKYLISELKQQPQKTKG